LVYGEEGGRPFMGHPGIQGSSVSENVAQLIDEEIRSVIDRNYHRAETILQENIDILHKMADALVKWETIDHRQIEDLMAGREPRPPMNTDDTDQSVPNTPEPGGEVQGSADEKATAPNQHAGQL
jgi:cell division protease FtsH